MRPLYNATCWNMRRHAAEGAVKMTTITYGKIDRLEAGKAKGPHLGVLIAACTRAHASEARNLREHLLLLV